LEAYSYRRDRKVICKYDLGQSEIPRPGYLDIQRRPFDDGDPSPQSFNQLGIISSGKSISLGAFVRVANNGKPKYLRGLGVVNPAPLERLLDAPRFYLLYRIGGRECHYSGAGRPGALDDSLYFRWPDKGPRGIVNSYDRIIVALKHLYPMEDGILPGRPPSHNPRNFLQAAPRYHSQHLGGQVRLEDQDYMIDRLALLKPVERMHQQGDTAQFKHLLGPVGVHAGSYSGGGYYCCGRLTIVHDVACWRGCIT
jgi:hypothetical protein